VIVKKDECNLIIKSIIYCLDWIIQSICARIKPSKENNKQKNYRKI
jgi:hypothetical protein